MSFKSTVRGQDPDRKDPIINSQDLTFNLQSLIFNLLLFSFYLNPTFIFSGVIGLLLKRPNPGAFVSGGSPWGYQHVKSYL